MFDPSNDLATVADGIETVTLLRRGSTLGNAGTVIPNALRRAMSAAEATIVASGDVRKSVASGGQNRAVAVVWHLPVVHLPVSPRLGDVLLDNDGQRWTILEVKRATLGARWRCETKNVAVEHGLDDTIAILKRISGVGNASVWRTWQTGIRARIQPISTKITSTDEASTTTHRFRVFVEDDLTVDHDCRIRGADGVVYAITGAIGSQRIGELQTIEAQIVSSSSENA